MKMCSVKCLSTLSLNVENGRSWCCHSDIRRSLSGVRGGFCEVQWVNCRPPLSSYNWFACLQVDTLIELEIYNIKSKEVIHSISHPSIPNWHSHLPA
jgi:hypothetical protein